jgi:hypothetical protein
MASNSLGRPKFAYHIPSTAAKQVTAALQNPYEALVTLQFSRLRHLCRFEKGGYCKRSKKELRTSKLPPNPKIRIMTILHQLFNPPARVSTCAVFAIPLSLYWNNTCLSFSKVSILMDSPGWIFEIVLYGVKSGESLLLKW